MMNKLWLVVLLFGSTSLPAAEKADFTLKWQTEQASENDPILRWRAEQKKKSIPRLAPNLVIEHQSRKPSMFDRVDKAHRQSYKDPNFSSFKNDYSY